MKTLPAIKIRWYANTLRNIKRADDAIPLYETAIQYDPMAVEAYVALAQIADIRGDLNKAYHYYARTAEIINMGNYYKVAQNEGGPLEGGLFTV